MKKIYFLYFFMFSNISLLFASKDNDPSEQDDCFKSMPVEIIQHIGEFLDVDSLNSLRQVNSYTYFDALPSATIEKKFQVLMAGCLGEVSDDGFPSLQLYQNPKFRSWTACENLPYPVRRWMHNLAYRVKGIQLVHRGMPNPRLGAKATLILNEKIGANLFVAGCCGSEPAQNLLAQQIFMLTDNFDIEYDIFSNIFNKLISSLSHLQNLILLGSHCQNIRVSRNPEIIALLDSVGALIYAREPFDDLTIGDVAARHARVAKIMNDVFHLRDFSYTNTEIGKFALELSHLNNQANNCVDGYTIEKDSLTISEHTTITKHLISKYGQISAYCSSVLDADESSVDKDELRELHAVSDLILDALSNCLSFLNDNLANKDVILEKDALWSYFDLSFYPNSTPLNYPSSVLLMADFIKPSEIEAYFDYYVNRIPSSEVVSTAIYYLFENFYTQDPDDPVELSRTNKKIVKNIATAKKLKKIQEYAEFGMLLEPQSEVVMQNYIKAHNLSARFKWPSECREFTCSALEGSLQEHKFIFNCVRHLVFKNLACPQRRQQLQLLLMNGE